MHRALDERRLGGKHGDPGREMVVQVPAEIIQFVVVAVLGDEGRFGQGDLLRAGDFDALCPVRARKRSASMTAAAACSSPV